MRTFFITGLPRSRTAWLANFMTCGETMCFHDAFRLVDSAAQMRGLFAASGARNVGNSDPANLFYHRQLIGEFPLAKWVVINRPMRDVVESARKAFGWGDAADEQVAVIAGEREHLLSMNMDTLIVEWDAIDADALKIATFCVPDFKSPECRNAMLNRMNVQIHQPVLENEIAAHRRHVEKAFGASAKKEEVWA